MPEVKTWIYRNKNCTKDELAEIKGCGIATMYRILSGVPSGTKVDDIIDNYIVRQPEEVLLQECFILDRRVS